MLGEAFRVMKKGAAACFTIWGRRDQSLNFTFFDTFIEQFQTLEEIEAYKK
jgi:hypothetical protein